MISLLGVEGRWRTFDADAIHGRDDDTSTIGDSRFGSVDFLSMTGHDLARPVAIASRRITHSQG